MAVTHRSKSHTGTTGASPLTLTEPAGAASGDMLVALVITDAGHSLALPAGWTLDFSGTQGAFDWIVGHIARGGAAPDLSWTHTNTIWHEGQINCLTNGATVAFDAKSSAGASGNGSVAIDPPAVVAVASSSLVICGGVLWSSGNWTAASGYTYVGDGTAFDDLPMQVKSLSASGSENPGAFGGTPGSADDYWHGFSMTFTDGAGGTNIVPIVDCQYRSRRN